MHYMKISSKCKKLTPPPELTNADLYRGFVELCKRVLNLDLPPNWRINSGSTLHGFKKGKMYEVLFDICSNNILNLLFRVFAWCLPTVYEIYK